MPKAALRGKGMRILVTNDDGINAPGLKVLEKVARSLSRDVWVVAPEVEQSGAAHSLTLRRPLQVRRLSPRRFAVDGTPTDCVLVAVNHIMPRRRPYLWSGDFSSDESIDPSSDLAATRDGAISVTPLHLDLTHEATLRSLAK